MYVSADRSKFGSASAARAIEVKVSPGATQCVALKTNNSNCDAFCKIL